MKPKGSISVKYDRMTEHFMIIKGWYADLHSVFIGFVSFEL